MSTIQLPEAPTGGAPPPENKRPWYRRWWGVTGVAVFLLILVGIIASAISSSKQAPAASPAPRVSTSAPAAPRAAPSTPAPTKTVTQAPRPAPTVTKTVTQAPPQPAAPPADTIITRFRGTGSGNTGTFTVPANGEWHLSWAYTNGSLFAGQPENFQVYEYSTDGTLVNVLVNALAVGHGQPTALPVYADPQAGQQVYFKVNTEDASWELVPVTGTS